MEVARANPGVAISGIGGIETGFDAAQFMLLGASTVQVCTGAMLRGYDIIGELRTGLEAFMAEHGFRSVREFVGASLPYFSTHADLVERQRQARVDKAGRAGRDNEWKGEIAKETEALTSN
jgi:dihydropyrimidine dehydrogenase (NADP+)